MTLKEIRKKNQLSLLRAAQLLDVSQHTLRKYENGQRVPSLSKLYNMFELYGDPLQVLEALKTAVKKKEG